MSLKLQIRGHHRLKKLHDQYFKVWLKLENTRKLYNNFMLTLNILIVIIPRSKSVRVKTNDFEVYITGYRSYRTIFIWWDFYWLLVST